MGRLIEVIKTLFQKKGQAPGKAIIIQSSIGEDYKVEKTTEMYHPPGVSSRPTKGDRIVEIPVGTGVRIAVASHNYSIEVEPESGEIIIYSTNSAGSTVQATIKLTDDGNIELNGNTYNLVMYQALASEISNLQSALNNHVHTGVTTGGGSSGVPATPISIDISGAKTDTLWTDG